LRFAAVNFADKDKPPGLRDTPKGTWKTLH